MFQRASLLVLIFIFACAVFIFGQDKNQSAVVPVVRVEPWVLHEKLTHEVLPEYPASAHANHIEGNVMVNVVVDENGKVQDVMPLDWPPRSPEMRDAAVATIKKWEYQPILKDGKPVPVRSYIAFRFQLETEPHVEVLTRSESSSPDPLGQPHGQPVTGGVLSGLIGNGAPPPKVAAPRKIEILPSVAEEHLVHKVDPLYPQMAVRGRIQGTVVLRAVISKNGIVEHLMFISGHPILWPAARDAVQLWKYSPFLVDGNPVEVETNITVTFHL